MLIVGVIIIASSFSPENNAPGRGTNANALRDFTSLGSSCIIQGISGYLRDSQGVESSEAARECVDVWTYDFTLGSKVYTSVPVRVLRRPTGPCSKTVGGNPPLSAGQSVECWKATRPNVGTPYECTN
mmetsp:Transcript_7298/g.19011  ORF Transcript_7298/g.19011 Transcript_7298/m.19011 type:complete len:128 (-) Transcript_7298:285-668(-)